MQKFGLQNTAAPAAGFGFGAAAPGAAAAPKAAPEQTDSQKRVDQYMRETLEAENELMGALFRAVDDRARRFSVYELQQASACDAEVERFLAQQSEALSPREDVSSALEALPGRMRYVRTSRSVGPGDVEALQFLESRVSRLLEKRQAFTACQPEQDL